MVVIEKENQSKKDTKKKKKEKDKKKKQYGGFNKEARDKLKSGILNIASGKNIKKKNNQKESSLKKKYLEIFEKCYPDSRNLNKIYIEPYKKNISEYFKQEYENFSQDEKIPNPFNLDSENKPLKTYLPFGSDKKPIWPKLKFDIFQSLYLLKNIKNKEKIEDFLSKIKMKLIYVLYSLYKIKKNIYSSYIEIISEKINNTNLSNNQKSNNSTSLKKTDLILNSIQSSSSKLNIEVLKIEYYIKLLRNKIVELEDKKGIRDYDKIILKLEEEIKKAIIQKYNMNRKINK